MLLRRLRRFICRLVIRLLGWLCPEELHPRLEVLLLRAEVERLLNRNLELEHRLQGFVADQSRVGVNALAATLVQSIGSAEQAMAEETVENRRYTISEMNATLRGFLAAEPGGFVLRPATPAEAVSPEALGTLQMTIIKVPVAVTASDGEAAFADALEGAQAAFSTATDLRAAPAHEIVAEASYLLAIRDRWDGEEFIQGAQRLAQSSVKLADVLRQRVPPEALADFRASALRLRELTQTLAQARRATHGDLERLATGLVQLTQSYLKMTEGVNA